MKMKTKCQECGGQKLRWQATVVNDSDVQEGRLRTHEMGVLFFLGCDDCSATVQRATGDQIARHLNDAAPGADEPAIVWPKARDVGRIGDMSPSAHLRIGLDSDNDVYASIWDERGGATIEFCTPGAGGGKSSRTRMALLAVMVAMEADNAADPGRDWWAERNGAAQAQQTGQ